MNTVLKSGWPDLVQSNITHRFDSIIYIYITIFLKKSLFLDFLNSVLFYFFQIFFLIKKIPKLSLKKIIIFFHP